MVGSLEVLSLRLVGCQSLVAVLLPGADRMPVALLLRRAGVALGICVVEADI